MFSTHHTQITSKRHTEPANYQNLHKRDIFAKIAERELRAISPIQFRDINSMTVLTQTRYIIFMQEEDGKILALLICNRANWRKVGDGTRV